MVRHASGKGVIPVQTSKTFAERGRSRRKKQRLAFPVLGGEGECLVKNGQPLLAVAGHTE